MTTAAGLEATRFRLAWHYLGKLRQASATVKHGHGRHVVWLYHAQKDWEQIQHWQAWSAAGSQTDDGRARLCATFPLAAEHILRIWQSPWQQLAWVRQALDAARKLRDDDAEFPLLYQATMLCLTVEALDEADRYVYQYLERAQAAHDTLSIGRAWHALATAEFTRGAYDTAETYFNQCIPLLEACANYDELARVWRGLGRLAQFRGRYPEACEHYRRYLQAASALANDSDVLDAHMSISGIYLALHDFQAAEDHARQAVAMARTVGTSMSFPRALLVLAHAQKWLGKLESACANYEEALKAGRTACPPSTIINGLHGLGQARFLQGDYAAAQVHFLEALPIAREVRLPLRLCEVSHDLVFVYAAQNALAAAGDCLQEACETALQLGTPHFLAKALAAAIALWHRSGGHVQAAVWAGLLTNYRDNLHPSLFDFAIYDRLRDALGEARCNELMKQGQGLTLADAVAEALRETPLRFHEPH